MCTVDHAVVANAGYLFDARVESLAPASLCTRILAHREEVGLSTEQVDRLLDLNREYHQRQLALVVDFMDVRERLEIKYGRVDAEELEARERLLDRHAELFREHEALFFEFASRAHDVMSEEQSRLPKACTTASSSRRSTDSGRCFPGPWPPGRPPRTPARILPHSREVRPRCALASRSRPRHDHPGP